MNIFIATINHTIAELTAEESWHCTKVLRFKAEDEIGLIDGKGNFYEGQLSVVNERNVWLILLQVHAHKTNIRTIYFSNSSYQNIDRIEWLVEKAVEIGVDEITFVRCKNSERTVIKEDRLIKIAESAVKQSLQAYIPKINVLTNFADVLKTKADNKFIAHCEDVIPKHLKSFDLKNKSSLVLIGPEGDFSIDEIAQAKASGFSEISLGENRLRTETAGLYVCNVFALI
ncbi:MAG: 16S rRNA (uracil(1498)-N(3))-methyltransferase [Sphingobacteriaceae bacterium]|nr:16S rRNA (uracil(1498)-N(3))-methyltransferase [Sphingobacteriaceae bacterium]